MALSRARQAPAGIITTPPGRVRLTTSAVVERQPTSIMASTTGFPQVGTSNTFAECLPETSSYDACFPRTTIEFAVCHRACKSTRIVDVPQADDSTIISACLPSTSTVLEESPEATTSTTVLECVPKVTTTVEKYTQSSTSSAFAECPEASTSTTDLECCGRSTSNDVAQYHPVTTLTALEDLPLTMTTITECIPVSTLSTLEQREPVNPMSILDDVRMRIGFASELSNMTTKNLCTGRFLTMHKRRRRRLVTRCLYHDVALLDDLQPGNVQFILDHSVTWRFNAFTFDNVAGGRSLPEFCVHLFQMYGLISYFKLDAVKIWRLFSLIEEGYHGTNPYHNSVHAADVTQAMHCFLQQRRIRQYLEPMEVMAALVAAIAHDMDHPGVNQQFLSATSNHLAALYRNVSVLENHHWRSAVSCLIESGFFDDFTHERRTLEHQISSLIIATDITRQTDYLLRFQDYMDTNTLDMTNSEHRHLVLQIALKCADISNPCRPWEISRKWSFKVCEEFFRQGDYERRLHLPVTGICDRHTTSIPKIQTGFFSHVVTPLISQWHRFLQSNLSSQMLENLQYNKDQWEKLLAQELAEETRTEISDADMVENNLETSSETLTISPVRILPLRRSSLNTTKQSFTDHLRRFSVPLNIFQDSRLKSRGKGKLSSSLADSTDENVNSSEMGSEYSIHSQLSVQAHCESRRSDQRVLSTENLLPDSSIASITTPMQATRLNTVIREGGTCKLIRQQTFPPIETPVRVRPFPSCASSSNEDAIFASCSKALVRCSKFSNIFISNESEKTVEDGDVNRDDNVCRSEKESKNPLRKNSLPGSQLRENLASVQLEPLGSDALLKRRRSMPTDAGLDISKEKKTRDVSAIPELLQSERDNWLHRRGSAPAPVAPSELRRLEALRPNGNKKKASQLGSCQQWFTMTPYSAQDLTFQQLPRRSSLPVEIWLNTAEKKEDEPKSENEESM